MYWARRRTTPSGAASPCPSRTCRTRITSRDYPRSLDYYNQNKNVLILHTFSKAYGLAGLRLGYGFARPEIVGCLGKVRLPFNASRSAQAAAVAALDDKRHVVRSRQMNEAGKEFFYRADTEATAETEYIRIFL